MAKVSVEQTVSYVYRLTERLFVNADKSQVVEAGSAEAAYLLGGPGAEISEADVDKYGLLASGPDIPDIAEAPSVIQGKLPPEFPGYAWLVESGITTYAKLRKVGDVTTVSGIGKATAQKIAEALGG